MAHSKAIAVLLLFAGSAAADLEIYNVTGELLLPYSDEFSCVNPDFPGVSYEYFDVRQPPTAQPVASADGNLLIIGDCDQGGSFARHIVVGNCPASGGNIRFAANGQSIPAGTLFDISGNANSNPIPGPYAFSAGESVGPGSEWDFQNQEELGSSEYWTRPPIFDITDDDFRDDIDWVGSSIIIGLEITEPDGVHYGWIEIQRLPGFDQNRIDRCNEQYRVIRYAYETTPGTPALVTPRCLPDTNGDGSVTPSDFTAWVNAFNNNFPGCDQNGDGACTPTDFTAWVSNFNKGC